MASISGVIYIGVTNDLRRRVWEHKNGFVEGFTMKYKCKKLVYFETGESAYGAITREKVIKKWRREKKVKLIESLNKNWQDLSINLF